jgi:sugar lactone lactonase YvrE
MIPFVRTMKAHRKAVIWVSLVALGVSLRAQAASPSRSISVGPNPESVVRGFAGRLYVTLMGERREQNDRDGRIVAVDANDGVTTLADGFDDPKGIVFTGKELITADFDKVWAIDESGRKRLIAGPEKFPTPPLYLNDVALEPSGASVLVTDMGARTKMMAGPGKLWPLESAEARQIPVVGRVYRVSLDGRVSVVIDHDARMPIPNGIDRLDDGSIRIGEFFRGTLLEWRNGNWREIGNDFRSVDGLAHDRSGNLYATEVFTGKVWRVNAKSGERTLLATLQSAADLILDERSRTLIVPDSKAGTIVFVPTAR